MLESKNKIKATITQSSTPICTRKENASKIKEASQKNEKTITIYENTQTQVSGTLLAPREAHPMVQWRQDMQSANTGLIVWLSLGKASTGAYTKVSRDRGLSHTEATLPTGARRGLIMIVIVSPRQWRASLASYQPMRLNHRRGRGSWGVFNEHENLIKYKHLVNHFEVLFYHIIKQIHKLPIVRA